MPPVVSSAAGVCSVCGAPLGANDTCVACLLRAGLEDAASDATRFGDYEIARRDDGSLWELGRGAMGVTYRAIDTVLHRAVALKVIDRSVSGPDSRAIRERFLREARAAAALRHPHIAGVFQFGASPDLDRCYCAMELVEGETLEARVRREGPLDVAAALEIALQVTEALCAAAEGGLVHRDLKPGNIMLARTEEDPARIDVKVIDFGLAKASTDPAGEMELTHGGFVGTPAFASPEQFAGGTIDARSDIFALGVTLWFALTGRLPFAGSSIAEIRQRQLEIAPPVEQLRTRDVPHDVVELLSACIAHNLTERPATARELMKALQSCRDRILRRRRTRILALAAALVCLLTAVFAVMWIMRSAAPAHRVVAKDGGLEKAVAVLPFENRSADPADTFLAEGLQDDVLTTLGKIKNFRVIARASVDNYRDAKPAGKLREIGQTLGVSHVVNGSVRRVGDRVVVNVALIDARDESQVWAERFERPLSDAASLQGELALEIARALRATLHPTEQSVAVTKPTSNPEAYLFYLRARDMEARRISEDWCAEAVQFYQRAVELDPEFALARARVSINASSLVRDKQQLQWKAVARKEAEAALRLQPELGEARLALALSYLWGDDDDERATAELEKAAELMPSSAEVQLVAAFLHKRHNRYAERVAALQRAEALDPRSVSAFYLSYVTQHWLRNWSESIGALKRAQIVSTDSQHPWEWEIAVEAFQQDGDLHALQTVLARETAARPSPRPAWLKLANYEVAMLRRDYAGAAEWLATTADDEFGSARFGAPRSFHLALVAIARGDDSTRVKEALTAAHQACEEKFAALPPPGPDFKRGELRAVDGLISAFAGRKEEAIATIRETIEQYPNPDGSVEKNQITAALALAYALTGDHEKAIDVIERLLQLPAELPPTNVYNLTLTNLKWSWVWDPLRDHPRFQKLLAGPEPKTIY